MFSFSLPTRRAARLAVLTLASGLAALPAARAESAPKAPFTTVFSIVSKDFARKYAPDGKLAPMTYAFGEGSFQAGREADQSIDELKFPAVAATLGAAMRRQNYVPATKPEATELLVVVHWGTTAPFSSGVVSNNLTELSSLASRIQGTQFSMGNVPGQPPASTATLDALTGEFDQMMAMQQMADEMRDRANAYNARILGYAPEFRRTDHLGAKFALSSYRQDLVDDVEEERYFVVLIAYDFQKAWREKVKKVMWVTRFSIRAQGSRFDRDLAAMARVAANYMGRGTPGLVRTRSTGTVEIGDPTVLGYEEPKKD